MSGAMITVNGEPRPLPTHRSVKALLRAEGLDPARRGIAVAVNGAVVPRQQWDESAVGEGDTVEIVKPFSGG